MNDCRAALAEMNRRLDEPAGPRDPALDGHLASCTACRERFDDLAAISHALRGLGAPRLDDAARDEILRRTAGAPSSAPWRTRLAPRAAAACLLLAALAGALLVVGSPPSDETIRAAEIDRAADDVRLVLGLTTDAIDRSRETVVREIFDRELRPALDRLPVLGGRAAEPPPPGEGSS